MHDKPVYLNLFTFKFPITAITSIMHRISGVILFFLIPFFLSQLDTLLLYPERFTNIRDMILNRTEKKLVILFALILLAYHFFAGIRHLIMDIGFAEDKQAASISSYAVFVLTIGAGIIMGIYIW